MDLKKFVLEGNPVCRKEAVIVGDHFRITMLTTSLIRFEYSEDGGLRTEQHRWYAIVISRCRNSG